MHTSVQIRFVNRQLRIIRYIRSGKSIYILFTVFNIFTSYFRREWHAWNSVDAFGFPKVQPFNCPHRSDNRRGESSISVTVRCIRVYERKMAAERTIPLTRKELKITLTRLALASPGVRACKRLCTRANKRGGLSSWKLGESRRNVAFIIARCIAETLGWTFLFFNLKIRRRRNW